MKKPEEMKCGNLLGQDIRQLHTCILEPGHEGKHLSQILKLHNEKTRRDKLLLKTYTEIDNAIGVIDLPSGLLLLWRAIRKEMSIDA